MMSSLRQPAKNTGKHAREASMFFWSMHALSSHITGSRPRRRRKVLRQSMSSRYLATGSSCQEWLKNASTCPSFVGTVRSLRLLVPATSVLPFMSSSVRVLSGKPVNFFWPFLSATRGSTEPIRPETVAAARVCDVVTSRSPYFCALRRTNGEKLKMVK
eukprot:3316694-Prymnesium_polylepis.3